VIFGDPILQNIVMTIMFGSKQVSAKDIPIGLRWQPFDGALGIELYVYAGMLVNNIYIPLICALTKLILGTSLGQEAQRGEYGTAVLCLGPGKL
jgi:hypothetical protein